MTATRTSPAAWPGNTAPTATYPPAATPVAARGCRVAFADGIQRTCGTSGLWNANLGHSHPAVADRIAAAAREQGTLPLFRKTHAAAELASERLLAAVGPDRFSRVVWTGSGASANEAAVKLSRQAHALAGAPRRRLVVAFQGSYHGLTFGASAHTGEDVGQRLYGVDQREVRLLDPSDADGAQRLLASAADRIACIIAEPVMGTGTVPLPVAASELIEGVQAAGGHVVADEVATGFGRVDGLLASDAWSVDPDIVLLSKGLTNGAVPGAALCVSPQVVEPFAASDAILLHAETGAGHPLTTAAVLAVLDTVEAEAVFDRGHRAAAHLGDLLGEACDDLGDGAWHRGRGLFRSLGWTDASGAPAGADAVGAVIAHAHREGRALLHPGPGCVQFVPPVVATDADLAHLVDAARAAIAQVGVARTAVIA